MRLPLGVHFYAKLTGDGEIDVLSDGSLVTPAIFLGGQSLSAGPTKSLRGLRPMNRISSCVRMFSVSGGSSSGRVSIDARRCAIRACEVPGGAGEVEADSIYVWRSIFRNSF